MLIDPLSRYPAVRTSSVHEFEYRLRTVYGATGVALSDASTLDARGNFVSLQDIALGFSACGTAATIDFGETAFARLQLPLRGQGSTRSGSKRILVSAGGASLTSPGHSTVLHYGVGFEHLFLRVQSQALRRKLTLLADTPVHSGIEFELGDFDPAMLSGLKRLIGMLVQHCDDGQALLSPMAVREMEQAVIVQMLFASRHNYSALLSGQPKDSAAWQVRQVEAYIEANWNQPILVEDLAAVAGVSARSLYKSFEKNRGCSPMIYVKHVRLRRAHDLLTKPGDKTTVTGVALACGFLNLGHFARDYRSLFGELPSETLRRRG